MGSLITPKTMLGRLRYECSKHRENEGDCADCMLHEFCCTQVNDWPIVVPEQNPPLLTLHDLYDAAQERFIACQCPTLTVKGFTNVQRYLGLRTSIEKESVAIQQGNYPFAFATNMKHSEYSIFAIPYLRWIQERSADEWLTTA